MPLLPIPSWGTKLWVAIDGRAVDRHNRCACCRRGSVCDRDGRDRNPWNSFANLMHDRYTYMPWSIHTSRARPGQCVHTAISRHAVEVFIDMPKPQAS